MAIKIDLRVPGGNKSELLGTHGLFSISMSIDKILMCDDCLKKTIHIINATFKSCHIVISDVLQRFNLMMNNPSLSEKEAFNLSYDIGNRWLKNNASILDQFSIPYSLFRWADWTNKIHFDNKKNLVYSLFEHDVNFKMAVAQSIQKYYERKFLLQKSLVLEDYLKPNFELAHRFILEEAAVMLLWCDVGYNFELHTSNRNAALNYVHKNYYQNSNVVDLKQARIKVLGHYEKLSSVA